MKSFGSRLIALLTASIIASAIGAATAAAEPPQHAQKDWTVTQCGAAGAPLVAGRPYALRNVNTGDYVRYGERDYGINLMWTKACDPELVFHAKPGESATLQVGQRVAISFPGNPGTAKYVRYGEREYGINLVWSTMPVYEWTLTERMLGPGGLADGLGFGLYNSTIGSHVVYCEREYGINLRWAEDCGDLSKQLVGSNWDLWSIETWEGTSRTDLTLASHGEGLFFSSSKSGAFSDGCNVHGLDVSFRGAAISLRSDGEPTTIRYCPPDPRYNFTTLLYRSESFDVQGDVLRLYGGGNVLSFIRR